MAKELNVALDLGGDSLKIAYAYEEKRGKVVYGKFTVSGSSSRVAYPALAFYDDQKGGWIYGEDVDHQKNVSFVKLVKIKDLLNLLLEEKNEPYYSKNHFPKFFFPKIAEAFDDFEAAVNEEKTFTEKKTPKEVCEGFFRHVKGLVDHCISKLSQKTDLVFDTKLRISIVHPPKVNERYLGELSRLVKKAFGVAPFKILSSTKALGMYAKHKNLIEVNDSLVIFEMGEEDISVAKVFLGEGGDLFVDGVEGHVEPLHVGGVNVDYAIAEFIEGEIKERDTVGTPAVNSQKPGHIYEDALISKQYLFMKNVKKAKTILSCELDEDSVFENGVPVGIHYELYIQRNFSRAALMNSIGTATDSGLALKMAEHILEELGKPLNIGLTSDPQKAANDPMLDHGYVVLSGGLAETYSLKKYIESKIHNAFPDVDVMTFSEKPTEQNDFSILSHEGSAYAPAVGGALVSLYNDEIKTILSYSYGTWVNCNGIRCLDIFVDRGRVLSPENAFTIDYGFSGKVTGERLYSTVVTHRDIEKGFFRGQKLDIITDRNGKRYLRIGEESNDPFRDRIRHLYRLETVAGGDDAVISTFYLNNEVSDIYDERHNSTYVTVTQGIKVDSNGKISPHYGINPSCKSKRIYIKCYNNLKTPRVSIFAGDLEIRGPKLSVKTARD